MGLKKSQNPWLCDTLCETEKIISQITCPLCVVGSEKKEEPANPGLNPWEFSSFACWKLKPILGKYLILLITFGFTMTKK